MVTGRSGSQSTRTFDAFIFDLMPASTFLRTPDIFCAMTQILIVAADYTRERPRCLIPPEIERECARSWIPFEITSSN